MKEQPTWRHKAIDNQQHTGYPTHTIHKKYSTKPTQSKNRQHKRQPNTTTQHTKKAQTDTTILQEKTSKRVSNSKFDLLITIYFYSIVIQFSVIYQ